MVKALVEGFGGGMKESGTEEKESADITPEAMDAMQRSAAQAIAAKSGNRLPVMVGKDLGLPIAPPMFDLDEMRRRNEEVTRLRALRKVHKP